MARSILFPTITTGIFPMTDSTSLSQKSCMLWMVSMRERSPTRMTPWAPLMLAVRILEYSFWPRTSQIIILRLMIRLGLMTWMSFLETFVPMVAMYLSSNLLTTYLAMSEVLPTPPSPRRTTFLSSSRSSIQGLDRWWMD